MKRQSGCNERNEKNSNRENTNEIVNQSFATNDVGFLGQNLSDNVTFNRVDLSNTNSPANEANLFSNLNFTEDLNLIENNNDRGHDREILSNENIWHNRINTTDTNENRSTFNNVLDFSDLNVSSLDANINCSDKNDLDFFDFEERSDLILSHDIMNKTHMELNVSEFF